MFQDRRRTFIERFKWPLTVNEKGHELDEFDDKDAIYVIFHDKYDKHIASTRIRPTISDTMIGKYFRNIVDYRRIKSDISWEVSRFCTAQTKNVGSHAPAAVMLTGCKLADKIGVRNFVGLSYPRQVRIWAAFGWTAEILARSESGETPILACSWKVDEAACGALSRRLRKQIAAGLFQEDYDLPERATRPWEEADFPPPNPGSFAPPPMPAMSTVF
ncbi:MAG: acyl-homoserine-lactone synthase [Pseudomonadota bacterium]